MIAIALSLLAAVGFGSAPVFTRTALQGFSFLPAVWMSLIVSFFLALALAVLLARQDIGNLTLTAFLWILAVGVTHHVCGRPQNYFSVSIIGASRASLFFSSQAPVAAFVAVVFLGESLSTPIILGTAAVVAGLIAGSGDSLLEGWRTDRRYLFGYLVALSAGTVYGMVNIFVKKANESVDSPLLVTSISLLLGISLLAPLVAPRTVKEVRNTSDLRRTLVFVVLAGSGRRSRRQLPVLRPADRRCRHRDTHRLHRSPGNGADCPPLLRTSGKCDASTGRWGRPGRSWCGPRVAGAVDMTPRAVRP